MVTRPMSEVGVDRVKRIRLWSTTCAVTAVAALLAGCGGSGGSTAPDSTVDATPSAGAPAGRRSAAPASDRAAVAEKVKSAVEAQLSVDEGRFGSGSNSPCATASAKMFTRQCAAAAKGTKADASFALAQVDGHEGFAALRSVAREIQNSAAAYQRLGCAANPSKAATRHACLEPAAVLAQGFPDLRDGANLGLAGK
ncbi:hypothetical protein [Streptomyces sp. SID1034]|uniref:hypothetical protein n=1 Tax=Streptomyces sp. SID1034 TaxID=2690248 RepID=UPI00136F006A|nr:hypothetical protein [Streptomyces sp. SID1034]